MDAYIFALAATTQAASAAVAKVGTTARVALPTSDDRALYVAVEGSTQLALASNIVDILSITGLGGTETYIPEGLGSPPFTFPTYAAVNTWIGIGLVVCNPGNIGTVGAAIAQVTGVVGLSLVTGSGPVIMAEVTASSEEGVGTMLDDVEAVSNVQALVRSVGQRANGAGFTSI